MAIPDTTAPRRAQCALVAVSPAGQATLRAVLEHCEADFVTTYPDAAAALTRRPYSVVIVGLHFGESRMLDFIQLAREIQPCARVVAVMGSRTRLGDPAPSGVQLALRALSVEGLLDLTPGVDGLGSRQLAANVHTQLGTPMRLRPAVLGFAACTLIAGAAWAADAATGINKTTISNATRSEDSTFARLDTNKDGYIEKTEAGSDAALARDFATFDLNNDGKLNRAEYVAARAKEDTGSLLDKLTGKDKAASNSGSTAK